MNPVPAGWLRRFGFGHKGAEHDVDAELRFHISERIDELVALGHSSETATKQAHAEFGDLDAARTELTAIEERIAPQRDRASRWEWFTQDLGYVIRSLRRSPAFVLGVVLTLALGLGANAAVFTFLDRLMLRQPAGVAHPASIRRLNTLESPQPGFQSLDDRFVDRLDYASYRSTRAALPDSIRMAGYSLDHLSLSKGADAPQANASYVLGEYFALLGVQPLIGRFFGADELRVDAPSPVAVISYRFWTSHFGRRQDIAGTGIELDGRRFTIIGVGPGSFTGIDNDAIDVWVPMNTMAMKGPHGRPWFEEQVFPIRALVAAPSPAAVALVEQVATTTFRHAYPQADSGQQAVTSPLLEVPRPGRGRQQGEVPIATRLAGVSLLLLLIACANVANLMLVRGLHRRREMAVRLALGVSRARLIRLLLLESLVVAALGSGLALLLAWWGGDVLRHLLLPRVVWAGPPVDMRIVVFTLILAIVSAVAAGTLPALQASRPDVVNALKAGSKGSGMHRSRWRSGLVVVQAALSVVLLAGAGLFVRSLRSIDAEGTGYDVDRLVFATVGWDQDAGDHKLDADMKFPDVVERVRHLAGVETVAVALIAPMSGQMFAPLHLPDRDSVPRARDNSANYVSPEYFAATGMRVVAGRGIATTDLSGAPQVVVVSETMARTFWPGENPLSKCVIVGAATEPCRQVVGVVTDAHVRKIVEAPMPAWYLPIAQSALPPRGDLIIRAAPDRASNVAAAVRAEFVRSFGAWAVPRVRTMADNLAPQLRPWRTGALLFSAAGLVALLVAIVGIYGSVSHTLSQRINEMGIRVALGARSAQISGLVLGEALRLVAVGAVIGVLISLAAAHLVESMLYHTSARDPMVLATVSFSLVGIAMLACVLPAWRATHVDPAIALRME